MADMDRIRSKIKADPRFKKIRSIVKTNQMFSFSINDYRSEAANMFRLRRFRDLDTDSVSFIKDLNKAYAQDLSYRSRMTEMYVACNSARGLLNRLLTAFYDYAIIEYYADLKSVGTAEERKRLLWSKILAFSISSLAPVRAMKPFICSSTCSGLPMAVQLSRESSRCWAGGLHCS